jgi:UPF0755 protein
MLKAVRLAAVLALLLFAAAAAWLAHAPAAPGPVELAVRPGMPVRAIARELAGKGVLLGAEPFVWLARISGRDRAIRAGNYEFDQPQRPLALLQALTEGDDTQVALTIIEGWTFAQMQSALAGEPQLKHTLGALTLPEALRRIGVAESSPEGLFFPDTYHFAPGSADLAVYRRAYRAMQERLAAGWQARDPSLPYATPYEALIMASIVEKETGQGRDRPQVASVFVNRLRLGMKLQTDPTVIYGMGAEYAGSLRKRDLDADTAYNTYTRAGLPPTPIALPGQAALDAALHPDQTRYLYFVSRGDGTSQFSTNLDDHNRAVSRYQRGGR